MASATINDQRRKEDLELLALFDPDCPQDLSIFESNFLDASYLMTVPSKANEFQQLDENVNVANWTLTLDQETLAYLDEIIASEKVSSLPPRPKSGTYNEVATFSCPRKFKCPMCPKDFYSKVAMRNHGRRHILKLIRCPCGFRGQSLVQQQKHFAYHHVGVSKHKFLASF